MIDPNLTVTCPDRITSTPQAGPRILVFGSARSGTTLLLNLFRTFDEVAVLDSEHCVRELIAEPTREPVVAKRTPHCADHIVADLPHLTAVWIVDIVRDPRDVVTSRLHPWPGFYCEFPRWERDFHTTAQLRGRHMRLLQLRYERLVEDPDDVQCGLAGILGLVPRVPFSQFTSVVPAHLSAQARTALGGVRPPSQERVGRWARDPACRQRVMEQLRVHPQMETLLQAAGYQPTEVVIA